MSANKYIGVDIGSVSINVVILNANKEVINDWYVRSEGKPLEKTYNILKKILNPKSQLLNPEEKIYISATGSGGRLFSDILGIQFVNEVIAQAESTAYLYPEVRTVIEIGGEDSKFINIERDSKLGVHVIRDFAMNTICAAGTGSFLDQQASRLGLTIEEFSELGLKATNPPRIAGRCSVFANTDMIHLQQEATPVEDIVAGLCFALARNFKSVIAKGKKFNPPVSFQGGVAYNKGMVRAFREVLGLKDDELIVPKYVASMGAIGTALLQITNPKSQIPNIEKIPEFLANHKEEYKPLKRLSVPSSWVSQTEHRIPNTINRDVWLGIDVGSISTNVVLIDRDKRLVARKYLWTSGNPISAVMRGLKEIRDEVGLKVEVKGVGVTGSGRYMIGDLVGADVVKNEITSQARAGIEIDPTVDTIFEIGGQDSKYISLQDGVVVDFEMNKVCAAGTGSFLEEQAEKLNLNVCKDFAECAFKGEAPVNLGERCTVFMQSNLNSWLQKGASRENLSAGLAYSIAYNYLNRVVGNKKIGNNIFFQGAVAHNKAIVSAFEELLGRPIRVPPNNDVTGAIGVAIIAMEEGLKVNRQRSKFKGFNLYERKYNIQRFECKSCPNHCEIKKVMVEGEKPLYYGARCEKYENSHKPETGNRKPDLFKMREELLLKAYDSTTQRLHSSRHTIGIPRALIFHEYLPFWVTFFQELGCAVILSHPTNNKIIHNGVEHTVSEHCFPIKVCHGHILDLISQGVEYIFLPSVIDMQAKYGIEFSYACPYVQGAPYVIKSALRAQLRNVTLITPVLYLKRGRKYLEQVLTKVGNQLGVGKSTVTKAIDSAISAQNEFYNSVQEKGKEILSGIARGEATKQSQPVIVIVGRPYNTCDLGLNLNIPKILSELGILTIPMDFLPLESPELVARAGSISKDWDNMYWGYGQRILAAARIIKTNSALYPVYITNFGCGPDSFGQRYFEYELAGKPSLIIEVDEHSAPAGVITRLEAFLDSIQNNTRGNRRFVCSYRKPITDKRKPTIARNEDFRDRTLLIPFMGNHSYALASAFRYCGIDAEVIPVADAETLELGRKYTTGKECLPCIITTGDMIKILNSSCGDDHSEHKKIAFFMPEASGPCRFGQYNKLQRLILQELGYSDIPIVSPNQAKDFYNTIKQYGSDFGKRAWYGICAVDSLDKLARATRPYEVNEGETDKVYNECLNLICNEIENNASFRGLTKTIRKKFSAIPIKRIPKPLIGITGEIYVRSHHFSNNNIIRKIEELGGEALMSTTAEWFFYVSFRRKEDSIIQKNYKDMIMCWLKDLWLHRVEHSFYKAFRSYFLTAKSKLNLLKEPTNGELLSYSNPYLHQTVEGEAILTVGKCIDFINKGVDGIITVMPFTCMPGTNAYAVMVKVAEKYGIPYLNIAYDGLEQVTTYTRLEAFLHQASQHMKMKLCSS